MIRYLDRKTQQLMTEDIYYEALLRWLYSSRLGKFLATLIARSTFISRLCGWWQRQPFTKRKIMPFVEKYHIDLSDFIVPNDGFTSFNDFFIRKVKPQARPLSSSAAIIPADGRYLFYPNVAHSDGFIVKGKKFSLEKLLQDHELAKKYERGSMIIARLCPTDYHRFHFPCSCISKPPKAIPGALFSVNPLALLQNIGIFTENKRIKTELISEAFGAIQYLEIGATAVGSIHQTFVPHTMHRKGDEKGFFSFGGSSLVILFEPNRIEFDKDLIVNSTHHVETLCLMGQPLGKNI